MNSASAAVSSTISAMRAAFSRFSAHRSRQKTVQRIMKGTAVK